MKSMSTTETKLEQVHKNLTTEVSIKTILITSIINIMYVLMVYNLEYTYRIGNITYLELIIYVSALVIFMMMPSWHIISILNDKTLQSSGKLKIDIYKGDVAKYIISNIALILLMIIHITN